MNDIEEKKAPESGEKEIDLLELAAKLWANRRKIVVWGAVGAVVGLIIAFSIPKEYSASAKLAPETNSGAANRGLGTLAAVAGFGGAGNSQDAVDPELYPDVVGSIPFLTGLFDVEVQTKEDGKRMPLQEYMAEMRSPWWSAILALPRKLISALTASDQADSEHKLNPYSLTVSEQSRVKALASCIEVKVDPMSMVIDVKTQMQDPLVAAMLADTIVDRLQKYVTSYRTNKARKDLEYAEQINREAREEYYRAQKALADYSDRNQGIATQSARITRDRMENEASLAFTLYNQTSQRVQSAKAVVQEKTPVYTIIIPPTVPVSPSSPRKMLLLAGWTFLGAFACCVWILFLQPMVAARKKQE